MAQQAKACELTRRALLGGLAAAGAGFALWPHTPRSRSAAPPGRVVLTYWEKWTGAEAAALQAIIDDFNAAQDRIWVHRVPVSNIQEKAMLAIAGGDAPDLIGLFSFNVPQYAEAGALLALDELGSTSDRATSATGSLGVSPIMRSPSISVPPVVGHGGPTLQIEAQTQPAAAAVHSATQPEATVLQRDNYAPAIWSLLTHEGRLWAGVNACQTFALYYNREHFRQAGLDPDAPPQTTDELDAIAARLTRRGRGGRLDRAGFLPAVPFWWPYVWPSMFGAALYDAPSNRCTLASAENIAAYTWVQSYPRRYGLDAIAGFAGAFDGTYHSGQDPFFTGRVSMIVQGPWIANFARIFAPDLDYGCTPLPPTPALRDPDAPVGLLESDVIAIPRGCRQPRAALEFLGFMQRSDVQERLARLHCKASPMRSTSPGFYESHPNRLARVHEAIARSPRVQVAPRTRVWPQYAALIQSAFDAIWAGADVAATLRRTQAQVQALLETAALRRRQRRGPARRVAP